MSRRRRGALLGSALGAVAALLLVVAGASAATTVLVTPASIGVTWFSGPPADTRVGGSVSIAAGPGSPPLGTGSAHLSTADSNAKAQLFNYSYIGTKLANIDTLSYYDYRASSSTNSTLQRVALNIETSLADDGGIGFTTLVFEPTYQPGNVLTSDTWQQWNALNGGNAVWWSSKDIPASGLTGPPWVACNPNGANAGTSDCAGKLFVPLSSILAAYPNAKVSGGLGFNIGSGWADVATEAADALAVGVSGNTTTYNFDPAPTDTTAPTCVLSMFSGALNETIHVTVGDSGSGLASVTPVTTNATATVPPFSSGSTAPIDVSATKVNPLTGATMKITITDVAGNTTVCDPVVPGLVSRTLHRGTQRIGGLSAIQSRVTIRNNHSGLSKVVLTVNGTRFVVHLRPGASRTVNVLRAMHASGHNNHVTIRSYGRAHASARLTVRM